jgi:hypothetical protein
MPLQRANHPSLFYSLLYDAVEHAVDDASFIAFGSKRYASCTTPRKAGPEHPHTFRAPGRVPLKCHCSWQRGCRTSIAISAPLARRFR